MDGFESTPECFVDGTNPDDGRVTLDRIRPGHCATVVEVEADDREAGQLKAMGVCIGRTVMLLRQGDPMILKVLGSRIGVSSRLAKQVRVSPCQSDICEEETPISA